MTHQPTTTPVDFTVADGLGLGLVGLDRECRVRFWNQWMEGHSGIRSRDIIGRSLLEAYPEIAERGKDFFIRECLERGRPVLLSPLIHGYLFPFDVVRGAERVRMHQLVKLFPLVAEHEEESRAAVVVQDLTEQILYEEALRRLNRVLRGVRDVDQLITRAGSEEELFDGSCRILVEASGYRCAWIGLVEDGTFEVKRVASAGIEEESAPRVTWDETEYGQGVTGRALRTGQPQVVHSIQEDPASRPWHELAARAGYQSSCSMPLKVEGRVIGALTVHAEGRGVFQGEELSLVEEVAEDIAYAVGNLWQRQRRLEAEEAVRDSLREKEVMLREIHHRVKNNLQVLSSMLSLQARAVVSSAIREVLESNQARIRALAMLHESLYQQEDLAEVDFGAYLEHLARTLVQTLAVGTRPVERRIDAEPVRLDIDRAVPCAQIVTELIANILKHAFPEDWNGRAEMRVSLRADNGRVELSVADNGVGLPAGGPPDQTQSLGLRLVGMLAERQLDGTLEIRGENGTQVTVTFPLEE